MLVEVEPVTYDRTTNSQSKGVHSTHSMTFGSGTPSTWFGATSRVRSNHQAARRVRTCPLNGIVPRMRSNALIRSVTTMKRRASRSLERDEVGV
jgi:hypothetical protein